MGEMYGNVSRYSVRWWVFGEETEDFRSFEGERAYSQAYELWDELKASSNVRGLEFTRLDGDYWVPMKPPIRRRKGEQWAEATSVDLGSDDDGE